MKVLITAGPTREPIDAVRFIGNRSSGKMGIAVARAAAEAGHEVTLLLGPAELPADLAQQMRVYRFESTAELKQLLEAHFRNCDLLIMAAAVADYRPIVVQEGKLERSRDKDAELVIHLHPTPDLVALMAGLRQPGQKIVAFALEEKHHLEERAAAKMKRKGVDAIAANPLGTMESDAVTPIWLTAAGQRETPGRMLKPDFARWLIQRCETL